jgi:membrane-bound lytic murein transglycosylase F
MRTDNRFWKPGACGWLLASVSLLLVSCDSRSSGLLDAVRERGELVVLTTNLPTTWYIDRDDNIAGPEYDMTRAFAKSIGVKARYEVFDSTQEVMQALREKKGDIAAAGMTITAERAAEFDFGPAYQEVSEHLVCHRKVKNINTAADMNSVKIVIPAETSYIDTINQNYADIKWSVDESAQTSELLQKIVNREIDCTVLDSSIFDNERRYYPELDSKFTLAKGSELAWMFRKGNPRLTEAVKKWFTEYRDSGELAHMLEKYYGHIDSFDYVDVQKYLRRINKRLPKYEAMFRDAAKQNGLSWTMLAAQSYQESHWDPKAKSPTGVRGIMMLTLPVAKSLGVTSRLDAKQNIYAGAKHQAKMKKIIGRKVPEPERTWLALAAYNVGRGHFSDAQKLATKLGKDPNRWLDMKEVLPLLSQKEYFKKLKHGYARGNEPVSYVTRIREYHQLLEQKQVEREKAEEGPA